MATHKSFTGTGRRKESIARVRIVPGDGKFQINGQEKLEDYFGRATSRMLVMQPIEATGNVGKFDIMATLHGGGISGQAEALRHSLARALLSMNPDYRKPLRKNGYLTRDSRVKERKKYGLKKARKASQYSKR